MSIDDFIIPGDSHSPPKSKKKKESIEDYTTLDIARMLRKKIDKGQIVHETGYSIDRVNAIDANLTMGTYDTNKIRNRQVNEKEKTKIYVDIEKGMSTEDIADKYDLTRIKVMGFKAAYTKQKNLEKKKGYTEKRRKK